MLFDPAKDDETIKDEECVWIRNFASFAEAEPPYGGGSTGTTNLALISHLAI